MFFQNCAFDLDRVYTGRRGVFANIIVSPEIDTDRKSDKQEREKENPFIDL